jgi:hypothetical protein
LSSRIFALSSPYPLCKIPQTQHQIVVPYLHAEYAACRSCVFSSSIKINVTDSINSCSERSFMNMLLTTAALSVCKQRRRIARLVRQSLKHREKPVFTVIV